MSEDVFEIKVPKTLSSATVNQWFYEEGDFVEEGDDLVELKSGNEEVAVAAPVSGILAHIFYQEGEKVEADEVIAEIEEEEE